MSWNYRVCKEIYGKGTLYEEIGYTIREVYYDVNGRVTLCTEDSAGLYGESVNEIKAILERMQEAINKDVIDVDTVFNEIQDNSLD